jgi:hypothetical protein
VAARGVICSNRTMRKVFLVLTLLASSSVSLGECLPTPCYVETIRVESCRPVSGIEMDLEKLNRAGLEPGQASGILRRSSAVVLRGRIERSRALPQCGGADQRRLSGAS